MDVEVRNDRLDGNTVVTLQGPIDVDAALQLDALFSELIGQLAIRVVVDVAAVTVCEPAGPLALADAASACRRLSGYLRLAAPTPAAARTLITAESPVPIALYRTTEDACAGDPDKLLPPPDKRD
jgi:anti-anti-sigma factor